MGSPKVKTVDPAETFAKNLEIQLEKGPEIFAAESSDQYGRPAYAQLDLRVLREVMQGKDGQPGLLELYEKDIMPGLSRADAASNRIARESDIADVEQFGQRATEAFRQANPEQAALMDRLNQQAMSELDAGASLPPSLAREIEQQIRGSQAARGMGFGMADVGQEALIKGLQAEQLQRRRQQFAQNVVGMNAATATDPFLAILGRPGVQVGQAAGIASQGQSFNPGDVFNPESPMLTSLAMNNANAYNNAQIAKSNMRAGIIGGGLGAVGSIMGGWSQNWGT